MWQRLLLSMVILLSAHAVPSRFNSPSASIEPALIELEQTPVKTSARTGNATLNATGKPAVGSDVGADEKRAQDVAARMLMGDVKVARVLECAVVVADALFAANVTVQGRLKVDGLLAAQKLSALNIRSNKLRTKSLMSPTGVVVVNGDLAIVNRKDPDSLKAGSKSSRNTSKQVTDKKSSGPSIRATALLAEDIVISGVKQWKLIRHDSFEDETAGKGWSFAEIGSCNGIDHFLGGHCNIAGGITSKTFHNLPPHQQVRLAARYHMIDNWKGETAFARLGGHVVWAEQSRKPLAAGHGLEMCGSQEYPELRMSIPLDVIQPHSESFIEVSFGSSSFSSTEDPCSRSFGVDDVMLYVR